MSILEQSPSSTVDLRDRPTDWLRSLPAPGGVIVFTAVPLLVALDAIGRRAALRTS